MIIGITIRTAIVAVVTLAGITPLMADDAKFRVAPFSADVTIPIGHRCMGILPTKSKSVLDPLYAHGFVLTGSGKPIVFVAVDWCEIRNDAYDFWRDTLASAVETTRERVLVASVHQHDAPVVDLTAQQLLDEANLKKELCDPAFHNAVVSRVADAAKNAVNSTNHQFITHIGIGQAKVNQVASNRRVVHPNGSVKYNRYSRSGGSPFHSKAPEGLIDPWLKIISFWHHDKQIAALSSYAVHPMSFYGRGTISADFVGLARKQFHDLDPTITQIYASGCAGDVTAGKYNNGSQKSREVLTERMFDAMKRATADTKKHPIETIAFRSTHLRLEFHEGAEFKREALTRQLKDTKASMSQRILAAMSLSSRMRLQRQPIDLPCIDLGVAQIVLFPGETFVGYQLMTQALRPDSFIMCIGYGECWPGYIPTKAAFDEQFGHDWRWVAPGSEARMMDAVKRVLTK